ncbi:unnamed protein product, partial [marine sediment metagenome]
AKGFIDLVELILVSLAYPFSIWITRILFIPELDVKIFEGILFFAFIVISWFVLSRISAMAKIPRTQRYMTMAFQFVRSAFIILIGLLAVKLLFRLTSLPVLFIIIYVTTMFIVTVLFRGLAYVAL